MATSSGNGGDASSRPRTPVKQPQNNQDSPAAVAHTALPPIHDTSTAVFVTPARVEALATSDTLVPVVKAQAAVPGDDWVADFGQYKGRTFGHIYRKHPSYCDWACRQPDPSRSLAQLVAYNKEKRKQERSYGYDDYRYGDTNEYLWDGGYYDDALGDYGYDVYGDEGALEEEDEEEEDDEEDEDDDEEDKKAPVAAGPVPSGRLDTLLHRVGSLTDACMSVATQTEEAQKISSATQTKGGRISTSGSKRPRPTITKEVPNFKPEDTSTRRRSKRARRPKVYDSDDE